MEITGREESRISSWKISCSLKIYRILGMIDKHEKRN